MLADHHARIDKITDAYLLCESLQKKLDERDAEIAELRLQLRAHEVTERM
jgi:hypothetical protein